MNRKIRHVSKVLSVLILLAAGINYDSSYGLRFSIVNKAEAACYMSGTGSHHTLTCIRPRFPSSGPALGYWGFINMTGMSGSGVWDQGEDWSGDDAKSAYDKDMAEVGYDVRTGTIDAKEACQITAQIDKNYCRSGHHSAAAIVGSSCSLILGVVTSPTAGTAGVAVCAAAVGVKLNNELDACDLAYSIRMARCD